MLKGEFIAFSKSTEPLNQFCKCESSVLPCLYYRVIYKIDA